MMLRIRITIIALILYVGLFDLYIFEFLRWSPYFDKLFYNWLTFGALSFVFLDWLAGFVNDHHRRFTMLLLFSVIVNYLLVILTVIEFFNTKHPLNMFFAYDTTILFTTCVILYYERKYKVMTD